ncbi:hypothetical protein FG167_12735 [Lacinutrix sp. WUR7]|uniref:hypothetical protein n=1 Tax=Lacinutrix sp. WUR7 TaxID=2653681 RepID=UPI00193D7AB2|nr:hypothetical protein [Lacinutrix sp. WUR7]QRM90060.1 hypothetical protein FG167_12735 [Lacinutrix sp. WUR7]
MKDEELNKIIDILEINGSEEHGYFDLDYERVNTKGEEFSACIRTNKDGIVLFAKELLISLKTMNNLKEKNEVIKIEGKDWLGYDIKDMCSLIQPIYKNRSEINISKPYKSSFKDNLVGWSFMFLLGVMIVLSIIGIIQIIN